MRIAVISDIHGNLDALSPVLDDINMNNCKKIFCLGDLAMAGPEPSQTIKKIQELMENSDFTLIQGNTDLYLSEYSKELSDILKKYNLIMANAYECDIKELSADDKNFLGSLPEQKEVMIGKTKILLVHGSPRKNNENISPNLPIEEIEEMLKDTDANLILCGHTHIPCGYQTNTNQTVVNAGSVGRPFAENPKACYAIIDFSDDLTSFNIEHKLVKYDCKRAGEKLIKRNFEGADKLAKMLENATDRYPS